MRPFTRSASLTRNLSFGVRMKRLHSISALLAGLVLGSAAQAIDLTDAGYSQNFDSMGTTGTTLPDGWSFWVDVSGDPSTFTTQVFPGAVAGLVQTVLGPARDVPTGTIDGINAANLAPAPTSDRVIATSPISSGAGVALQLRVTNATTHPINAFDISFDVVRYSAAPVANELPGYSMLVTHADGTSGLYVPSIELVPNTVGTTHLVSLRLGSGHSLAPGETFLFWWFDDNAQQSQPDQIIGLNNVFIAPAPEPASVLMLAAGLAALGLTRARSRSRASRPARGATATPSARTAARR